MKNYWMCCTEQLMTCMRPAPWIQRRSVNLSLSVWHRCRNTAPRRSCVRACVSMPAGDGAKSDIRDLTFGKSRSQVKQSELLGLSTGHPQLTFFTLLCRKKAPRLGASSIKDAKIRWVSLASSFTDRAHPGVDQEEFSIAIEQVEIRRAAGQVRGCIPTRVAAEVRNRNYSIAPRKREFSRVLGQRRVSVF